MLETFNDRETFLIDQFKAHPLFTHIDHIGWPDLLSILIQRRFLSLSIVNVYEFVIDALTDNDLKETVRSILNEEFPRNTKGVPLPSHRELLFHDLLHLGASPTQILTTPETPITAKVRSDSYQLMVNCLETEHYQAKLITFLRFWAEVLVAVEYACLWPRLSERLSHKPSGPKQRSEFYYFHMIHDSRKSDIGKESILGGLTHAQELALHLKRLISREKILADCLTLQEQVYQLKSQFYSQFTHHHSGVADSIR